MGHNFEVEDVRKTEVENVHKTVTKLKLKVLVTELCTVYGTSLLTLKNEKFSNMDRIPKNASKNKWKSGKSSRKVQIRPFQSLWNSVTHIYCWVPLIPSIIIKLRHLRCNFRGIWSGKKV